ncbi:hypothetical protein V8E54_003228 [Elaphomyces granulatus]
MALDKTARAKLDPRKLENGLNSNTKLGIFNTGKTSSPVKPREVPDLTFSVIRFLSKNEELDRRSTRSNNLKGEGLETRQVSQKDISQ